MRVLLVTHGFPPHGAGGAEIYADACARRLCAAGDDVYVFAREAVEDASEYRVRDEARGQVRIRWINNTFRETRRFADTYDNAAIQARAAEYIDEVRPDVAHVHHLTCLSTRILDELAARGVPVVLTLHDYWLLCHRGQLFDRALSPCSGPAAGGCASCIGPAASAPPAAFAGRKLLRRVARGMPAPLARAAALAAGAAGHAFASTDAGREASRARLAHMRERWACVDVALAPSQHVRNRFAAAGFDPGVIQVSEYGVDAIAVARAARPPDAPLRVGYLGSLMVSKAPHVLLDAVDMLPPGSITVDVFGAPAAYHGDDSYVRALADRTQHAGSAHPALIARSARSDAVRFHGPISRAELPRALGAIDVLVFPSVWEEASGIGAREALSAGIPVVASRIGGIPEFVHDWVNGVLFEPGRADELARLLRRLAEDPGLLSRLRRGIAPVRSLDEDVSATRRTYESLCLQRAAATSDSAAIRRVAAVVLNYRTPRETLLAVQMLRMADPPLASIVVVDNGDGEACRSALASVSSDVQLLATGSNLGFSGGCNVGIRHALATGADAVLLVNSDVVAPPAAIGAVVRAMNERPSTGIAAPVVRSRTWPDRILSAGMDVSRSTGRMLNRPRVDGRRWAPADGVTGCCMLIRRAVFERVGLLPEEYFFSFEDLAFCQQAIEAGFEVGVTHEAAVFHEGGATMGTDARRLYFAARNHLRLARGLPARSSWHRATRQWLVAGFNLAHACRVQDGKLAGRVAAVARGVFDHARGRFGPG